MGRLIVYNQISLDGFFVDAQGDMSWAHSDDAEWNEYVAGNAAGGGQLIMGRLTYELMAQYWPTQQAKDTMPEVADRMNNLPKIVCSRTLDAVSWDNSRLVRTDLIAEIRKIKNASELSSTILGSGTIVAQLAEENLIDEYQIVVTPIVLGTGRTLFEGVTGQLRLKLIGSRVFENGKVLLCYVPVK